MAPQVTQLTSLDQDAPKLGIHRDMAQSRHFHSGLSETDRCRRCCPGSSAQLSSAPPGFMISEHLHPPTGTSTVTPYVELPLNLEGP